MGDGAAHLVDHVLPTVPYRQFVVSCPFELNARLAFRPALLAETERAVTTALCAWMKQRSGGGQPGGVLVRHRFGGSLNLHVHAHMLVTDGAYVKSPDGMLPFERAPALTTQAMDTLAQDTHQRLVRLYTRRVLLGSQEGSNEPEQLDALEQCGRFALSQGSREKAGPALAVVEEADLEQTAGGHVVNVNGLNVYGSAVIGGTDRERLERICRYLLRGR